ncbi:radical SAM protein [Noviherbaspirillum denitrificans]|uniref:Radical SAM core domain-containing protein n=1 Tax=Noviherbaspirillum denitrificans TaxID=1968433 RepID=A0A254TK41_9BURK|nr:radical SAM protein [Noviherbaspirillum denitrificans]OWW21682.1 hypothetical protein AYR66_21525 [Noviherbaspirillum denitrificans]
MTSTLTHEDIQRLRRRRGRSMLLFITDRCPVGCAHCSVDSRTDSPTIIDFALFDEILDWLCSTDGLDVVDISGGEPFAERRGLELASERLAQAGKRQVVHTSGIWAGREQAPAWIRAVLARCSCVYLGTDAFHAREISGERFVHAARAIAEEGAWIVVQVLGLGDMAEHAEQLLRHAFGAGYASHAEIVTSTPLTDGRGASVFFRNTRLPGHAFGTCWALTSPMVRYDGVVSACCNESVIMGHGPSRLRRRIATSAELDAAIDGFRSDPLLRAMESAGLGVLTQHPRFADLAEGRCGGICELCWKMLERAPDRNQPDRLIQAVTTLRMPS